MIECHTLHINFKNSTLHIDFENNSHTHTQQPLMEVQPTKSSAKATTKNMSEKEKKYVTVLKELGLENDCTVEAYLRAYVNHLAAELEDKVERQVQAFQNRFLSHRKIEKGYK